MISFQSVVLMLVAVTAKAAIVSPSSSPFTVTVASPSVGFPGNVSASATAFPVTSSVFGSAEPTAVYPSSVSTFDGSGVSSSVDSVTSSVGGVNATGITSSAFSSAYTSSGSVATSTAVFTFTYVPISTVTVTEYRCHRPTSVISVHPSTVTSHPITISEPGYPISSFSEFPGGTISASSVLPEGTISASSVLPEGTFSASSVLPEGTISASSVAFSQPTTSFV